jgi:hypothetical protein
MELVIITGLKNKIDAFLRDCLIIYYIEEIAIEFTNVQMHV